jgi:hypothetical protein
VPSLSAKNAKFCTIQKFPAIRYNIHAPPPSYFTLFISLYLSRNVADRVIYKAQKAHRQGGGGGGVKKSVSFQKPLVASSSSSSGGGVSKNRSKPCVFEEKLRNIRTGEVTTLRMFEDSDDSSSEDGDPFDDILTTLVP